VLNTLSLAVDTFDQSEKKEKFLEVCNLVFTWLFAAEMVFKIIGLGPSLYTKDVYNVFDSVVVILSIVDFIINASLGKENVGQAAGVLKAFRALRLMRMIKLARRWTALTDIMKKIYLSLDGVSVFTMLLVLFMYIFSLLGMQLFGTYSYMDLEGNAVLKNELVERYP
jgi:voltage-dependent calcium channel T type alpha-1I